MAPKSGTKRAAQATKTAQPAKVQKKAEEKKVEEVPKLADPLLEGLINAVQRSELPAGCKEMLIAMMPGSFTVPLEQRHELQSVAVRMVGEVIEHMHGEMTKELDEVASAMEAAAVKQGSLEATVVEAESQASEAAEMLQSKETALREATKLASEKQTMFDGAKDAQTKGDAELGAMKQEKETYQTAFTDSFKLLCDSKELEGYEAVKHYKVIQPLIAKLELEDSFALALPSTCQKKPSERGPFDTVIMDQLGKKLTAHISALEERIENFATGVAERASAVQTAEQELNVAKVAKETAEQELGLAQAKRKEAVDLAENSKKAVSDVKLEMATMTKNRDAKVIVRTEFEKWNMDCFTKLKEKTALPKETSAPKETGIPKEADAPKEMAVEEVKQAPVAQGGA